MRIRYTTGNHAGQEADVSQDYGEALVWTSQAVEVPPPAPEPTPEPQVAEAHPHDPDARQDAEPA